MIKNETNRLGLGSFKALGGAFAVYCFAEEKIVDELQRPVSPEDVLRLSPKLLGDQTLVCASAGNHGLSVAKGAYMLGIQCEIFLSEQVPVTFDKRLEQFNAKVVRAGETYEDSMSNALERAAQNMVTLISDSSWKGETHYPSLVMQGYSVLAEEMCNHFNQTNDWPTHVALQAGVGGMAAAVTLHIREKWPVQPEIIVVEPEWANCLQLSVDSDGITYARGPVSNMGRLDCKEPSMLAFHILKERADRFVTVTEKQAIYAKDKLVDFGIESTTSGTAGLAGLLVSDLPANAKPLIIVTESLSRN